MVDRDKLIAINIEFPSHRQTLVMNLFRENTAFLEITKTLIYRKLEFIDTVNRSISELIV